MVVIQCPHCGKDVELDYGVSGLFGCPFCNSDFSWEESSYAGDLKIKFLIFLFGIFSPSIVVIVSFWIMIAAFSPTGWDGLLYFFIGIGICILYTLILAIYGGVKKNKPLLQGVLLSLVASYLSIYLYPEFL